MIVHTSLKLSDEIQQYSKAKVFSDKVPDILDQYVQDARQLAIKTQTKYPTL